MSVRARTLARRFEEVHNDVLELAWTTDEEAWSQACPETGWPVGGVFRHVGRFYLFAMHGVAAFFSQSLLPAEFTDWTSLDRWNVQFSMNRPKDETVALLQTAGLATSAFIGALSDPQLDRVGYFPLPDTDVSAEEMVEHLLIAHPEPHLDEIRAVLVRSAVMSDRQPACVDNAARR